MPGLVDCGVVLRTALPSGNASFTSFDQSLQGTVCSKQSTPGVGGAPYSELYGEAPPERGAFFKLAVYKRVRKIAILV